MSKLYTESELCEMLGISRTTIYRLHKSGLLKAVRFGRSVRYTQEQIDDLLRRLGGSDSGDSFGKEDAADKLAA